MSVNQTRLERAKAIWRTIVASKYLETPVNEKPPQAIYEAAPEALAFLAEEPAPRTEAPNAMRSFVELGVLLPMSFGESHDAIWGIQRDLALFYGNEAKRVDAAAIARFIHQKQLELNDALAVDGRSYMAADGPYSSVYAALIAMAMDDLTVARWIVYFNAWFYEESFLKGFQGEVLPPHFSMMSRIYRGQRGPWPPRASLFRNEAGAPIGGLSLIAAGIRRSWPAVKFVLALAKKAPEVKTDAEHHAVRQHYGQPTPLLDFTDRLEVAGFFATRGADGTGQGVIYRYHLAHLYFRRLLREIRWKEHLAAERQQAEVWAQISWEASHSVKLIRVPTVARIAKQSAVFVDGLDIPIAQHFLQPVTFRHHPGVVFEDVERGVSEAQLFPPDDPLKLHLEAAGFKTI
jgi:hypothetical protein